VRRAAPAGALAGLAVIGVVGVLALAGGGKTPGRPAKATASAPVQPGGALDLGTAPAPLAVRLEDPRDAVRVTFKHPPRAGLLFDVDTGQVLWRRNATRRLPIASLTKMMTALVVSDRVPEHAKVRITAKALHYRGSGVGMFRRGRRISANTMLHGLLLPSGNDAARALAERAGGTITGFVALMNARSASMGLTCSRFSSPDGFVDR
jgi:D-alanyl-D-alanine carboxypeptidase